MAPCKIYQLVDLIDLRVYYDLSSVQIHDALYEFFKSHCMFMNVMYYEIDYVNINTNLNTLKRTVTQFDNIRSCRFTVITARFEVSLSYKMFQTNKNELFDGKLFMKKVSTQMIN